MLEKKQQQTSNSGHSAQKPDYSPGGIFDWLEYRESSNSNL